MRLWLAWDVGGCGVGGAGQESAAPDVQVVDVSSGAVVRWLGGRGHRRNCLIIPATGPSLLRGRRRPAVCHGAGEEAGLLIGSGSSPPGVRAWLTVARVTREFVPPHVVQNFAPGRAGVPQLGQRSIIPFHDPCRAMRPLGVACLGRMVHRGLPGDHADASMELAGTRRRCDNPTLTSGATATGVARDRRREGAPRVSDLLTDNTPIRARHIRPGQGQAVEVKIWPAPPNPDLAGKAGRRLRGQLQGDTEEFLSIPRDPSEQCQYRPHE